MNEDKTSKGKDGFREFNFSFGTFPSGSNNHKFNLFMLKYILPSEKRTEFVDNLIQKIKNGATATAKPATDPAKPATDPAKPATDPAKPAAALASVKPSIDLPASIDLPSKFEAYYIKDGELVVEVGYEKFVNGLPLEDGTFPPFFVCYGPEQVILIHFLSTGLPNYDSVSTMGANAVINDLLGNRWIETNEHSYVYYVHWGINYLIFHEGSPIQIEKFKDILKLVKEKTKFRDLFLALWNRPLRAHTSCLGAACATATTDSTISRDSSPRTTTAAVGSIFGPGASSPPAGTSSPPRAATTVPLSDGTIRFLGTTYNPPSLPSSDDFEEASKPRKQPKELIQNAKSSNIQPLLQSLQTYHDTYKKENRKKLIPCLPARFYFFKVAGLLPSYDVMEEEYGWLTGTKDAGNWVNIFSNSRNVIFNSNFKTFNKIVWNGKEAIEYTGENHDPSTQIIFYWNKDVFPSPGALGALAPRLAGHAWDLPEGSSLGKRVKDKMPYKQEFEGTLADLLFDPAGTSTTPAPALYTAQPVPSQPVSAQPVSAQPVSAQPVPAGPVSAQPDSAQPVSAGSVSAEPVSGMAPLFPARPDMSARKEEASTTMMELIRIYIESEENNVIRADYVRKMQTLLSNSSLHAQGFNDASELMNLIYDLFPLLNNIFKVNESTKIICQVKHGEKNFEQEYSSKTNEISIIHLHMPGNIPVMQEEFVKDDHVPPLAPKEGCNTIYEDEDTQRKIDFNKAIFEEGVKLYDKYSYTVNKNTMFLAMMIMPIAKFDGKIRRTIVDQQIRPKFKSVFENVNLSTSSGDKVDFKLMGIVYVVYDPETGKSTHYVAHGLRKDKWWLFNDSRVSPAEKVDVLTFKTDENATSGKTAPLLLFYARKDNPMSLPAVGLQNPGAACYFNALLQGFMPALAYMESL